MYHFQYNYIKPKYGNNAQLLFKGRDSLMHEIKTDDFYKDIADDIKTKFDTSNYPEGHKSITQVINESYRNDEE